MPRLCWLVGAALCAIALKVPHSDTTAPHLCGPECGALFATYPHNDSCWRSDTGSWFAFDVQPHFHVSDSCFGENDPSAPFYFNGTYHMMWQSHTQYQHVPHWNRAPGGQFGDTGISFGHAVSTDLARWTQLENAVWPDEWFTSVSVYDGSATVIDNVPVIIAAGLTPNTTSVFCHARAVPSDLSDPFLEDWHWDAQPTLCGNSTNGLTPSMRQVERGRRRSISGSTPTAVATSLSRTMAKRGVAHCHLAGISFQAARSSTFSLCRAYATAAMMGARVGTRLRRQGLGLRCAGSF
eukprot:COSAG05_NODE_1862_length_3942_cov_5.107468_2_plen_295_part_00